LTAYPGTTGSAFPLGRVAQRSDVDHAVLFLLSDRASLITIQELVVDGGATLGA
jgi:2,3-dihydro-2,3-dihydroxybenzoate dehydrogenase